MIYFKNTNFLAELINLKINFERDLNIIFEIRKKLSTIFILQSPSSTEKYSTYDKEILI